MVHGVYVAQRHTLPYSRPESWLVPRFAAAGCPTVLAISNPQHCFRVFSCPSTESRKLSAGAGGVLVAIGIHWLRHRCKRLSQRGSGRSHQLRASYLSGEPRPQAGSQTDEDLEMAKARRAEVAQQTWRAVALADPVELEETWDLRSRDRLSGSGSCWDAGFAFLRGTYYLNGLASCAVGPRLVHPFEAHGFLRSIEFHGDGTATYRARFIKTLCTSLERVAQRPLFRGVMSNVVDFGFPLGLLNALSPSQRDTANLACRLWPPQGKNAVIDGLLSVLIVGGDNGTPMCLNPKDLATQGALDYDGLASVKWLAHTRYDPQRERLIFAGCAVEGSAESGFSTTLDFREYDINGKMVAQTTHHTRFMIMHDWIATEHYYVVPQNPAKLDLAGLGKFIAGLAQGTDVFTMEEDLPCALLLIPRIKEQGPVVTVLADRFFNIFHLGPTYELMDGNELIVHALAFDSYAFGGEMGFDINKQDFDPIAWSSGAQNPPPRMHRFTLDVKAGVLVQRERLPLVDMDHPEVDIPVDMPTFHPLREGREARYCYCSGAARPEGWFPFRSVLKVDLRTGTVQNWDAGEESIVSEPQLLPRGLGASEWLGEDHEDDGWLVSVVHNAGARRCELAVFDARRIEDGPQALIDMGSLSPWGVHGCWVPTPP